MLKELKKNDIIDLKIDAVTNEGNGVGRADNGMAVFVPFTCGGDRIRCKIVKVSKKYCYGIVDSIITPSQFRQESDCKAFYKCGGCSFRHIGYEKELEIKAGFVRDSFERIGKLSMEHEPILGCENISGYRNKAQLPVSVIDGRAAAGFYAKRSHRVIELGDCSLHPKEFFEITEYVLRYHNMHGLTCYDESSHSGLLRHIYLRRGHHTGEVMLCLVVSEKTSAYDALAEEIAKRFPHIVSVVLNINPKATNVILGSECITLLGNGYITDIMCGKKFEISPLSFYQVNTEQAERLYNIAAEYAGLTGEETLLDLYCGVGTIGISMADKVKKLIGVEIVPQAIENAKRNAKINGVTNAEFICADAGKAAQMLIQRGERPDVIIADPARKGCDQLSLDCMIELAPKRIVMVSCNHATAARDCAYLAQHGYKPQKCRAVDLFPRTTSVECVVLMERAIGER